MNRDAELRMIVQKLVHGSYRGDLVDRLLLGLRSTLRGGSRIRDIADFVAHPDQRDRGPLHRHVARIKSSQDFMFRVKDPEYIIKKDELIAAINDRHAIDTMGMASKKLGLTTSEIDLQIVQIKEAIANSQATCVDDCVPAELFPLFEIYLSHHMWSTVYNDDDLFKELVDQLIVRKILGQSELDKFKKFQKFFILHICCRLHLTQVVVDGIVFRGLYRPRDEISFDLSTRNASCHNLGSS